MSIDDLPTLRLVTLRRLVSGAVPPVVFDQDTAIATVAATLRELPAAVAVLVDRDGVFQGTLCLADLRGVALTGAAATVMLRGTPMLDAEHDVETATRTMTAHAVDRVLVVTSTDELLGVLTRAVLDASRRRAA